jgi:CubicO group peptidase (beta-lactamase class C family)
MCLQTSKTQYHRLATGLILIAIALLTTSCGGGDKQQSNTTPPPAAPVPYSYSVPEQRNDGWTAQDARAANIDVQRLETLMDQINSQQYGFRRIDGLAIVKDGKLVFEQRVRTSLDIGDGWAANTDIDLHVVNSVTKSVMSLAFGIALDQGLISGLDASIYDYLTVDNTIENWDDRKAGISIRHYLTMQHGYDWDEWNVNYLDSSNLNAQMNNSAEPIQFLLNRPMATDPGTTFAYSTGVSYALGVMIANASGTSFFDFLDRELLQPLNITKSDFWTLDGELHAGSALYLSLRDMAKIGQLVLDGGRWHGIQVVPEAWVNESIAKHLQVSQDNDVGYGYQWWSRTYNRGSEPLPVIAALGFGGQLIYVFKDLNAVIVFTGHRYNDGDDDETNIANILENYILPALPMPEN